MALLSLVSRRITVCCPRAQARTRQLSSCSVLAIGLILPSPYAFGLLAQAVSGVGDDAIPIMKGSVRYGVSGVWSQYGTVYAPDATGQNHRRPLLAPLGMSTFGVRAMPQLSAAEQAIRTLAERTDFTLSLGALEANGIVRQTIVPFMIDLGVTRRLSVGIVVPYVESKQSTQFVLNRDGSGANVGQNPAYGTTIGAAARSSNAQLLRQIALARTQLSAEIVRCAGSSATGCDAIKSGATAAQELLVRAVTTQTALSTIYGDSLRGGSPVVPINGTATQSSINAAITSLRNGFERFGVTSISPSSLPASATTVAGPGSLPSIAADSAYGLSYSELGGKRRAGIGDVDLAATVLLWDTFNADQRKRLQNRGRGIRSVISGGWRFGSAGGDRVDDPFDVPIGDGANALLMRSTTDILVNRRFWLSASARLVKPFADNVATAVPLLTDSTTFAAFRPTTGRRSLGQRIEFEVAPRFVLGDFFGISGAVLYRRSDDDRLTLHGATGGAAPATITTNLARSFQAASFAFTYSSLSSYARGRSRYPVEVRFVHVEPIGGAGGLSPAVSTDRLEFRLFTGFPKG